MRCTRGALVTDLPCRGAL